MRRSTVTDLAARAGELPRVDSGHVGCRRAERRPETRPKHERSINETCVWIRSVAHIDCVSLSAEKMGQSQDSSVQPDPAALNANINYVLLGIYGYTARFIKENELTDIFSRWEYIYSLHVEWAVIRGRITFRPSMVSSQIMTSSAE